MTTATPTLVDTRNALLTLARWQINGRLENHSETCMADLIRTFAPALKDVPHSEVLFARFEELCAEVALVDGLDDGSVHWCELIPDAAGADRDEQALEVAQSRLDDTLSKLTTPPGALS